MGKKFYTLTSIAKDWKRYLNRLLEQS